MTRRVMIVDDMPEVRLMLRYILEKEGYSIVAEAANGIEAVEQYREHLPDVTVMDIDMPFKSGVEAAREICDIASDARIIFCSGSFPKHELGQQNITVDGHSLIRKPFLPAQLYQALAA